MEIKWTNIIALILVIAIIVLLLNRGDAIGGFLGSMKTIGPGYSRDDQINGLVSFSLVGILIAAVVKILTQGK